MAGAWGAQETLVIRGSGSANNEQSLGLLMMERPFEELNSNNKEHTFAQQYR